MNRFRRLKNYFTDLLKDRIAICLIRLLSAGAILHLLSFNSVLGQGNLLLMPRRVIFEGAKRYEELNLANTGRDTAR